MHAYANVHLALESMRVRALRAVHGSPVLSPAPAPGRSGSSSDAERADPPRVLVLGPENSGKTSVCKILANYAVRAGQGWAPIYVNVDPAEVCPLHPRSSSSPSSRAPTHPTRGAGRLGRPRRDLRRLHPRAHPHRDPREPPRLRRDQRADRARLQRARAPRLLVRPPRDPPQPPPRRPPRPQPRRKRQRQARGRPPGCVAPPLLYRRFGRRGVSSVADLRRG